MNFVLDKFIRWLRFRKIIKYIPKNSTVCDIGCGSNAIFLKSISNLIKFGIGIDKKVEDYKTPKLVLKREYALNKIPLEKQSADIVTMTAVLEHMINPQKILNECFRILKNNGKLIITTPSPKAKPILEFLAFKLRLIDGNEIRDHKNYFWPSEIKTMLIKAGFEQKNIKTQYFEWRFNLLVVACK